MPKNKDGFEPGQLVSFSDLAAHLNKRRNEVTEDEKKPAKKRGIFGLGAD